MKKCIEQMNVFERYEAAEKGGSLALELDRLAARQLNDIWDELSPIAKDWIQDFFGCPGELYLWFGDLKPDMVNQAADELAEFDE